jgi:hypothetical protein
VLVVDDWIAFNADPQLAVMIKYVHTGYKGVYTKGCIQGGYTGAHRSTHGVHREKTCVV